MPVARKVWLQMVSGRPTAFARRLIMSRALRAIKRAVGQRPVPVDRAEEGAFLLGGDACRCEIGIHVIGGVVVGGHLVPLAALLMQPEPRLAAFDVVILHLHAEGGTDAGEAVDHDADQGPVA